MHQQFRLFRRRGGVFYAENVSTRQQQSLGTKNRAQAAQLLQAKNMASSQPALNRALSRTYLSACDPKMLSRTWASVFEAFCERGRESSRERSRRAAASCSFNLIRQKAIIETTSDDFLAVLKAGGAATNNYLRRFHNFALDTAWLLAPVLPRKAWPPVESSAKRRAVKIRHPEPYLCRTDSPPRRQECRKPSIIRLTMPFTFWLVGLNDAEILKTLASWRLFLRSVLHRDGLRTSNTLREIWCGMTRHGPKWIARAQGSSATQACATGSGDIPVAGGSWATGMSPLPVSR